MLIPAPLFLIIWLLWVFIEDFSHEQISKVSLPPHFSFIEIFKFGNELKTRESIWELDQDENPYRGLPTKLMRSNGPRLKF